MILGFILWCFYGALGATFLILAALETSLKIECFSRSAWASRMVPQARVTCGFGSESRGLDAH